MKEFRIVLNEIDKVKAFVNTVNKYPFDVEIRSGRYIIDAKSIMGVFSIDLSKPVRLCINIDDENSIKKLEKELKKLNIFIEEE